MKRKRRKKKARMVNFQENQEKRVVLSCCVGARVAHSFSKKSLIVLTSVVVFAAVLPAVADTFPENGYMQANKTYAGAMTPENIGNVTFVNGSAAFDAEPYYTLTAGYYMRPGDYSAIRCPAGFWCPGVTTPFTTVGATSDFGKNPCPDGWISEVGSDEETDCHAPSALTMACSAGQYLPANSSDCAICPENYYCEASGYEYSATQDQGLTACRVAFTNSGSESCNVEHATGSTKSYTQTCYHNTSVAGSTSSSACTGTADCGTKNYGTCYVGTCDTGYHKNKETDATSCVADTYTITYNLNGGTNSGSNPANYTIETNTITLGTPTKAGYTFGGWYDNSALTGTAVTQIAKGTTGNKTLWAKWVADSVTCSAGQYLPANASDCVICPENSYCVGGTYDYHVATNQGIAACTSGKVSPQGTAKASGCGKKMYVDNTVLYLTSEKQTTPALAVKVDGKVYYANTTAGAKPMSKNTTKSLRTKIDGVEYSIHDNTVQGE